MSKRFATVAVAVALAWQVGPVMAGPCDDDTHARQANAAAPVAHAKAETAITPIKAALPVVQVKADAAVVPIAAKAPPVKQVKVTTLAELSKDDADASKPDAGTPVAERAVTERPKAVGRGNRRGLTPKALALLARIEDKFGGVNVISGYRAGARIAGSGRVSRHASGNAIDFDAGGRKGAIVKWLIANHKSGGTMTYADMSHIHVDIGQHFVSLGANSRGGRRRSSSRRYAERGYEGRRYSNQRRYSNNERSYGNGRGYAQRSSGRSYGSGYATLYR